jgi:hypothetical protein
MSPTTPASCRRARPICTAPASAPSTTACATPCAAAAAATAARLLTQQGLINGVFDPNGQSSRPATTLRLADLAKVALSGTLRDYSFIDRFGALRKNSEIDYFGQQAGFAAQSVGDHQLRRSARQPDAVRHQRLQACRRSTSLADRVRVQNLGAAITVLSQGVPFIHAGQEILRSKSLDRDSYNAGDWFNKLDYSYVQQLRRRPAAGRRTRTTGADGADPGQSADQAGHNAITVSARTTFEDLLAIRQDSSLFRLRTAKDVSERLRFHNTGPAQVAGRDRDEHRRPASAPLRRRQLQVGGGAVQRRQSGEDGNGAGTGGPQAESTQGAAQRKLARSAATDGFTIPARWSSLKKARTREDDYTHAPAWQKRLQNLQLLLGKYKILLLLTF